MRERERERGDNVMRSSSRILVLKETDTRKQVIFSHIFRSNKNQANETNLFF